MTNPELKLRREDYRTFKYLAGFVHEWTRLGLDDDDLQELELLILRSPASGKVISGTGGLPKDLVFAIPLDPRETRCAADRVLARRTTRKGPDDRPLFQGRAA